MKLIHTVKETGAEITVDGATLLAAPSVVHVCTERTETRIEPLSKSVPLPA